MAVLAFTWTPWGLPLMALGGAVAAVVIVWGLSHLLGKRAWATVVQMLGPLRSIGRALLPLLLPILMIVAFATRAVSPILQFVAGVGLAALVWLFFRGEGEIKWERKQVLNLGARTVQVRQGSVRRSLLWTALPTVLIGLVGAVVILWIGGFFDQFSEWGRDAGRSGWVEFFALIFLSVAFPFRLIGYALNRFRIVAAVALAVLITQVLVAAGAFRGQHVLRTLHLDLGWASVGFLVLFVGVLLAEAVWVDYTPPKPEEQADARIDEAPPPTTARTEAAEEAGPVGWRPRWKLGPPTEFQQTQRAWGLLTAGGSAALLGLALVFASVDTTSGAPSLRGSAKAPIAPPIVNTPGGPDTDLAWTFAPLLHIRHDEHWGPSQVKTFLANAKETGAKETPGQNGNVSFATLPSVCPDGSHDPCGTLTCEMCKKLVTHWPTTATSNFLPKGVFYVRVARIKSDPRAFRGWNPFGSQLTTLVQYWLFYLYDEWETETVIGKLTQEHQADWEFVAVGLDDTNKPLFVAMSAHCGGQVVPWTPDLPTAFGDVQNGKVVMSDQTGTRGEASHPIVAVARGSHANYSDNGGNRPPDWGSCSSLPSSALTAVSYASNVRDLTEPGRGGWFVYPTKVYVVKDVHGQPGPPFGYPGSWGAHEKITFSHHAPIDTGAGPRSPPLQDKSWGTPIKFFFCDPYWHGDNGMHGTPAECSQKSG